MLVPSPPERIAIALADATSPGRLLASAGLEGRAFYRDHELRVRVPELQRPADGLFAAFCGAPLSIYR